MNDCFGGIPLSIGRRVPSPVSISLPDTMKLLCVVGARPNYMKMAPLLDCAEHLAGVDVCLVHTGQHFDDIMSGRLLRELGIPEPHHHLNMGKGPADEQLSRMCVGLEHVIEDERPDAVIVVGDVTSTLAGARAAAAKGVPIAHIEAGLRSYDYGMPEERNRLEVDHLAQWLFTTEPSANINLIEEGHSPDRIHFVGNLMIDTLFKHRPKAESMARWEGFGEERGNYVLMTMHRQAGVDDPVVFGGVIDALDKVQARLPVVFSLHPRTAKMLDEFDLRGQLDAMKAVQLMPPLSYLEFMSMMIGSRLVITDSGGIQEETTALGVPCLTIRWNTERPVTVTRGTNRLVGLDSKSIVQVFEQMMADQNEKMLVPELWDGKSADRVLNVLMKDVGVESSW